MWDRRDVALLSALLFLGTIGSPWGWGKSLGPYGSGSAHAQGSVLAILAKFYARGQCTLGLVSPAALALAASGRAGSIISATAASLMPASAFVALRATAPFSNADAQRVVAFLTALAYATGNAVINGAESREAGPSADDLLVLLCTWMVIALAWAGKYHTFLAYLVPVALGVLATNLSIWAGPLVVVCIGHAVMSCWRRLGDRKKPVASLLADAICSSVLVVCVASALTLLLCSLAPASETSFGGNVNLRYLSPDIRRALRSSPRAEELTPEFMSGASVSLYVQGGGFLSPLHGGASLALQDRVGRMEPWAVVPLSEETASLVTTFDQGYLKEYGNRLVLIKWMGDEPEEGPDEDDKEDDEEEDSLPSGAFAHVPQAGGKPFPLDAEDEGAIKEGLENAQTYSLPRLAVGLIERPNAGSVWELQIEGSGIRLYNPRSSCYLATTFKRPLPLRDFLPLDGDGKEEPTRSKPYPMTMAGDHNSTYEDELQATGARLSPADLVASAVRSSVQVGCNIWPHPRASTFSIVDVAASEKSVGTNSNRAELSKLSWSVEVLKALWRLRRAMAKTRSAARFMENVFVVGSEAEEQDSITGGSSWVVPFLACHHALFAATVVMAQSRRVKKVGLCVGLTLPAVSCCAVVYVGRLAENLGYIAATERVGRLEDAMLVVGLGSLAIELVGRFLLTL